MLLTIFADHIFKIISANVVNILFHNMCAEFCKKSFFYLKIIQTLRQSKKFIKQIKANALTLNYLKPCYPVLTAYVLALFFGNHPSNLSLHSNAKHYRSTTIRKRNRQTDTKPFIQPSIHPSMHPSNAQRRIYRLTLILTTSRNVFGY